MSPPRRVLKLGGSLLDYPELKAAFASWLQRQPAAVNVLLVGGGPVADLVRRWDTQHQLGPAAAHDLAIHAMYLNSCLVSALLDAPLHSLEQVGRTEPPGLVVLNPLECLDCSALPKCWDVTSDSLAAEAAIRLEAAELVLLKSALPANSQTLASAASAGLVDPYFPRAAAGLSKVRCVNLRQSPPVEASLTAR